MPSTPAKAAPAAAPAGPAPTHDPKPPRAALTLSQQRFRLLLLLVGTVTGAVAAVAYFKPDASVQTAIFTVIGTGFLGPLKDAFRHYFPGGQADQASK